MATPTVENYVKQIWLEQQRTPAALVPMGKLASAMNVVPGTATTMIKALADSELVIYEPRGGVKLTRGGEQLALHVLRRHRLVELFLVKSLGLDWSEVHAEAEELEHAISDKVMERIDALLGHPTVDPHGDPIPDRKAAAGAIAHSEAKLQNLTTCEIDRPVKLARVIDQSADFLQFLDKHELTPGVTISVVGRSEQADAVTIRVNGHDRIVLGASAALKLLVDIA